MCCIMPIICAYQHYISPLVLSQCLFTYDTPLTIPLDSDIGDVGVPEWVRNEMHSQRAGQHRGGLHVSSMDQSNLTLCLTIFGLGYISLIQWCFIQILSTIIKPQIWKKQILLLHPYFLSWYQLSGLVIFLYRHWRLFCDSFL